MLVIWFLLAAFVRAAELNSVQYTGVKGRIYTKSTYEAVFGSSSYQQPSLVASYFQPDPPPVKPANFEIVTMLCPNRPLTILFVTPKLVTSASSAVQSIFLRYKCQSLGLLVRANEVASFQPSSETGFSFFEKLTVSYCKNAFLRSFGIDLKLVLADTGCDGLNEAVLRDFEAAQMVLFRYPSCFVGDRCYYDANGRCQDFFQDENELVVDSSDWIIDKSVSLDFVEEYKYFIQYQLPVVTTVQPPHLEQQNLAPEDAEFDEITLTSTSSPHSARTNLDALEYDIIDSLEFAGDEKVD